jgi:hypothetical protein
MESLQYQARSLGSKYDNWMIFDMYETGNLESINPRKAIHDCGYNVNQQIPTPKSMYQSSLDSQDCQKYADPLPERNSAPSTSSSGISMTLVVDVVEEFDFLLRPLVLERKFTLTPLALEAVSNCSCNELWSAGVFSMARLGRFLDPPSLLSS